MKTRLLSITLISLLFIGCASTNRLREYDLRGKNVAFLNRTEVEDVSGGVWIDDPEPWDDKPMSGLISLLLSIFGSISADAKLDGAIDTEGVSRLLAKGIENTLVDKLGVRSVQPDDPGVDFLMATHVEKISLMSNAAGVFLNVKVNQQMFSAHDSSLVWEENLRQELPLRYHPGFILHPTAAAVGSVIGAVELLAMDQEQIQDAVLYTAEDAGLLLGDMVLRYTR
ncbi:MAG: hypothetical protein WBQ23_02470 [Bacteroidota bacterium]